MKHPHHDTKGSVERANHRPSTGNFSPLLLSMAWSIVCAAALPAQGVLAQTDGAAVLEEIIVTGRQNINDSLGNIKLNQTGIVDSLTFEQIGNLPDTTLAEVLDRVVGVSSDTGFNSSRPRTVSARGFDARYNSVSIDGNPVWNSSRNNRGTQLDVFPASVINQVDVFKTLTPEQDANSIGGHIEMRTLRAFDGGVQPWFKLNAALGHFDQSGKPGSSAMPLRLDAVGKFTFGEDNQYGIVLGMDYQQQEFYDLHNEVSNYAERDGISIPDGLLNVGVYQEELDRQSYFAKFETRKSDQLYAFVSASLFKEDSFSTFNDNGVFVPEKRVLNPGPGSGDIPIRKGAGVGAGIVRFEEYFLDRSTLMLSTGLDYRVGDVSSIEVRAGYTNYDHDEVLNRSTQFRTFNLSGRYAISENTPDVFLDQASLDRFTPENFFPRTGAKRGFDFIIPHEDDVISLNAIFKHNVHNESDGLGYSGGILLRRMKRTFDETFNQISLADGTNFTLADMLGGRFATDGIPIYFIDRNIYRDLVTSPDTGDSNSSAQETADYSLEEDVLAVHANLVYDWGGLRTSAGLRVEFTDVDIDTADEVDGAPTPVNRSNSYTNVLPNLHVTYDLRADLRLRFAYTESISRPDFSDFASGQSRFLDTNGFPVINGTNPELEARRARSFDLSIEHYFQFGFFSAGLFYKKLNDEIFRQRIETTNADGVVILTETFPLNNSTGRLHGFELTYVKDRFQFLENTVLRGLGLDANFTWLDGEWNVIFTDGETRTIDGLRNQPEWLASLGLFYERNDFYVGLKWRPRGQTFTGTFGVTEAEDVYVKPFDRLDLTLSYNISENLQIYTQMKNLTNSWYVETFGAAGDNLSESANPGRFYWFGVKYEL